MTLLELIVLTFATWQAVEIWRHSGIPLVADARSWLETREGFLVDLLLCPWCVSVHVAFWMLLYYALVGYFFAGLPLTLLKLPIIALAVSRAANAFNDVMSPMCRTPGRGD